jgi:hypothetical protein
MIRDCGHGLWYILIYLYTNNISICILLYVCESIILYDNDNKNYIYDIAK